VDSLPVFTWGSVSGAAKYEFQLAGTTAFSPALVDLTTGNRRAAVTKVLGNDTYYWRVRASLHRTNSPWSTCAPSTTTGGWPFRSRPATVTR
jgi:hypothetical protein